MKGNLSVLDATFGCYQLDCSLKLYKLVKSARTVSREF